MQAAKRHSLSDPIATCGDRVYAICSQNGLFPDSWGGHVPGEMWGVWDHPIKLLDGFWFGVSERPDDPPQWLIEADECRAYPTHNEFEYRIGPLRVVRRDFVPDGVEGMVVGLQIRAREPHAVTLHALFRSDLRPAWLGEEAGLFDGKDSAIIRSTGRIASAQPIVAGDAGYEFTSLRDAPHPAPPPPRPSDANAICIFADGNNPWTCAVGASLVPVEVATGNDLFAAQRTSGDGTSAHFKYELRFGDDLTATVTFFIAGSMASEAAAVATFEQICTLHQTLFESKVARYRAILEMSQVVTPDARLNEAMAWSKVINQMFLRSVPQFGQGVGAGLPEYPWWFGIDAAYAALPMLQSGQFELVRDTLRLLKRWSEHYNPDEPGRVIHEMSSTGAVFNKGNMVEVPAFTRAVHQYWLWSGDRAFLEEMYPFCKAGLLDYALGRCDDDGDLCPSGRSIVETVEMHAGFEVIDVAAYTWEALNRLGDMASAVGDHAVVPELHHKADALGRLIREAWWRDDEGLFADVRASVDEVERALDDLEQKAREQSWLLTHQRHIEVARALFEPDRACYADQPRDKDLPWLLRHWVVLCPVEVGIATQEQARRVLARLQSDEFSSAWGMVLHPSRRDVMSINTGLLALAAARYGYADGALAIVDKLVRALGYRTPGAVSEALPGDWCFLQLWSNLGLVSPVVECFLGIGPRAAQRRLTIKPNLPSAWNWAEVKRLRVGDAHFDVRVERVGEGYRVDVRGDEGWMIESSATHG